ncbi:MAG TPA: LemA family protein [Gemmatimonadaceae bacterium]
MSRIPIVLLLPLALASCGYNTIQRYDEQAAQSKQQIDVQLQRRADLVPNLVATVRGYAAHEEQIFTEVARARTSLLSANATGNPEQQAIANTQLTGALGRLLAIVENYPQLKADQTFIRLQDELAGTENRIAVARQDYNAAVNTYNAYIRQFPQIITARVTGARPREYFTAPGEAQTAPTVDFSK